MNFLLAGLRKPHWPTCKSMQAFLVRVPPLFQVIGETVPLGESQVMNDKDWGYVLGCETQTQQSLNFHQYPSCTIQQTRDKLETEKPIFVYIIYCSTLKLVFWVSFKCKSAVVFSLLISTLT